MRSVDGKPETDAAFVRMLAKISSSRPSSSGGPATLKKIGGLRLKERDFAKVGQGASKVDDSCWLDLIMFFVVVSLEVVHGGDVKGSILL